MYLAGLNREDVDIVYGDLAGRFVSKRSIIVSPAVRRRKKLLSV